MSDKLSPSLEQDDLIEMIKMKISDEKLYQAEYIKGLVGNVEFLQVQLEHKNNTISKLMAEIKKQSTSMVSKRPTSLKIRKSC